MRIGPSGGSQGNPLGMAIVLGVIFAVILAGLCMCVIAPLF